MIIEPGSKYLYSDGGYTVLQLLIEEVTKMPLGMKHSSFANDFTDTNISKAYGFFGQALLNYNYTEKSAAGLKTTVQDFLKFMLASMDGNNGEPKGREILKSENIDLILNSGLGTFKSALPDNSAEIGHVGSNKGWTSQYQIIPKKKMD
ncbi:serine hydrolase [Clostridium acetireducens]|uniref:serine hydrolase n=1 Tax=Clostridium acetireducens TaxID=76489 RepID=UPI0011130499